MSRGKGYPWRFAFFMMAYYATNAIYQGYTSVYFKQNLGFSPSQIGSIFAGISIVSVFTQPFWGSRGDRMKDRNVLIRFLCVIAAALMAISLLVRSYPVMLAVSCLFACFYMSIQPMGDSVILESLQERDQPFGPLRLCAGVSFAVFNMLFGRVVDRLGNASIVIYFVICGIMITCVGSFALPFTPGRQSTSGRRMSFSSLFRQRDLMLLLAFVLPLQTSMGYFYSFFSNHFLSLEGANSSLLGWCYFISAVSEMPYLIFSDRLFKKIGVGRLMCISCGVLIVRWIILAACVDHRVVMFSQIFHGWGFIVMTVAMSKYISVTVPPELKASGQMLLAVVGFGISRAVGNLGGGLLADIMGTQNVFIVSAALCFVTFLIFGPYYIRHAPMNGEPRLTD